MAAAGSAAASSLPQLDAFLKQVAGGPANGLIGPEDASEALNDEDDEYGDIDWCDGDELPDAAAIEAQLSAEQSKPEEPSLSPTGAVGSGPRVDVQAPSVGSIRADPAPDAEQARREHLEEGPPPKRPRLDVAAPGEARAFGLGVAAASAAAEPPVERRSVADRARQRELRKQAVDRHRALALCFVARLKRLNDHCDHPHVQAAAISVLPKSAFDAAAAGSKLRSAECVGGLLEKSLEKAMVVSRGRSAAAALQCGERCSLLLALIGKRVATAEEAVVLLVACCRAMGIPARLVILCPLPPASACGGLLAAKPLPPVPAVWAEVFDVASQRWSVHGALPAASRLSKAPWVLAAGVGGRLYDATRRYCARWTTIVASRGSLAKGWDSMIAEMGCAASATSGAAESAEMSKAQEQAEMAALRAELADERDFVKKARREPMPASRAGFKRHPTYMLESQLRVNEVLHPPGTKHVGLFQGKEPVYRRSDVAELKTQVQWRREGRLVRDDAAPVKVLRGGSVYASRLYGLWQTEVLPDAPEELDADPGGAIPGMNNYGNVELFDVGGLAARPPPGTVHISEPFADKLAIQLRIKFAAAVVGFTRERGGQAKPKYAGVVIHKDDEAIMADAVARETQRLEVLEKEQKAQRFMNTWKLLVKNILVDRYVEDRHRGGF
eukprot:TRINITY_DN74473_c0_g1_i1.p1 TRINITY_DN74473_c0_g1~~TRINITY_DN74473_c0_g1_i1.p1  ORF type:complete len:719 (+),score=156.94 TRINITY_DN74473_c0_g1_i1:150-2159(+)